MSKSLSLKGMSQQRANKILKINESKLDKYLLYYAGEILMYPDETKPHIKSLTETERDMLTKYQRVYEMFDIGRTDAMIRTFLTKEYDVEYRQALYIIEEARIIYGITGAADKEGRRRASINWALTMENICQKDKNYELALKYRQYADKLERIDEKDELGLNPEDFQKPVQFIFVNNLTMGKDSKIIDLDE
jgi:predicted transcriptional regulator